MKHFNDEQCDLCGSHEYDTLLTAIRSMTSDSRLTEIPLNKVACRQCGLARNRFSLNDRELSRYYEDNYQLNNRKEHCFVIDNVSRRRSEVIHEWIMEVLIPLNLSKHTTRLLEVGCGSGELLEHFCFTQKEGIELNREASDRASSKGLSVRQGAYWDIEGQYDLIVSFGVIEHVSSPSDFLNTLKHALTPNGVLLIGQPFQDVQSYDVFFVDHLHHFFLQHLEQYFYQNGLREISRSVGHGHITNFSLHLLIQNDGRDTQPAFADTEKKPVNWYFGDLMLEFQSLTTFLEENRQSVIYAYGAGERLKLYEANTSLAEYVTGCIDDYAPESLNLTDVPIDPEPCFILTLHESYQIKVLRQIRQQFANATVYSVQLRDIL
jgi:2-polyprenyl-3-methyl-5-hydroxy-6-metoxy-1,4-benzoquinol methylase